MRLDYDARSTGIADEAMDRCRWATALYALKLEELAHQTSQA